MNRAGVAPGIALPVKSFDTERIHAITAIREIEDRHGSYAERMSRLREQVLADLDALIAAERTKPEVTRP